MLKKEKRDKIGKNENEIDLKEKDFKIPVPREQKSLICGFCGREIPIRKNHNRLTVIQCKHCNRYQKGIVSYRNKPKG